MSMYLILSAMISGAGLLAFAHRQRQRQLARVRVLARRRARR